jgi:hypothetical protein
MKTTEDRRVDDAVAVANAMARLHRRAVGGIRNAGSKARVRTPAVVVRDPLPAHPADVILVERYHPVEAFAPNRANHASQNALACGDRTGVLTTVSPIAAIVRSTPSE